MPGTPLIFRFTKSKWVDGWVSLPHEAPCRAFFTIDQVVPTVFECRGIHVPVRRPRLNNKQNPLVQTDRRECTYNFQLNDEQLGKLKAPGYFSHSLFPISSCQPRLFCTSSNFYFSTATTTIDCPIEFPQTCDIYINDMQLKTTLLKGIKKRPGTAPPPELAPVNARNAVRMIYINGGQGQLEYKKYYLVVQLVKTTSVSALVDHLLKTRFVSGADIRWQMVASMSKDDDIIAGSLKMSFKYTPVAQLHAHHHVLPVCKMYALAVLRRDVVVLMMEQTTTWLCAVCENILDWQELIIDGYTSLFPLIHAAQKRRPESRILRGDPQADTRPRRRRARRGRWRVAHRRREILLRESESGGRRRARGVRLYR
ncbi:PINIT domain-containing protein [Mycena olivaceomarginata]|nr:PINIT domain-containing protein [Mycena olivaceomarginata]